MEVISNYALEDFSLKHKHHYNDYIESTEDFKRESLFYNPYYFDFEEMIEYYERYKSHYLDKNCDMLNESLKLDPNHRQPYLQPLRQMYVLMDKKRDKMLGMTQIYCERNCTVIYVPQVTIEVSPNERSKGYGRRMINLLLKDDRIGAEWLYFYIRYWNEHSMKLVESFEPEEFADVEKDYKIYKIHKKTE